MNPYISKLKTELEHNRFYHNGQICESVLELLWECYSYSNPIGDADVQKYETALAPVFEQLPFEDSNKLFVTVCNLCTAYQHAAFLEGVRIGWRLTSELESIE